MRAAPTEVSPGSGLMRALAQPDHALFPFCGPTAGRGLFGVRGIWDDGGHDASLFRSGRDGILAQRRGWRGRSLRRPSTFLPAEIRAGCR